MNATMQKQQKTAFEVCISRRSTGPSEAWRLVPEGCSLATSGEFLKAYGTSKSFGDMLIKAGPTLIVNNGEFSRSGTVEINDGGFRYIDITDYWVHDPAKRGLVYKGDGNYMVAYVNMDTSKKGYKDSNVYGLAESLFISPYSVTYFGKVHIAYVRAIEKSNFRLAETLRTIVRT